MPAPQRLETTYLDLAVGGFRLALSARAVIGVQQDVAVAPALELRGQRLRFLDLASGFGGATRRVAPFVIAFESGPGPAAVGIDAVNHLRLHEAPLVAVPPFGLARPALWTGAVRSGSTLLFVLHPEALWEYVTSANPLP